MFRMLIFSVALLLLFAGTADSREKTPVRVDAHDDLITNRVPVPGKASRDTFYLMGGPGDLTGKFEDANGDPDWQGWVSVDETIPKGSWSADPYGGEWTGENPGVGNDVAWCGECFAGGCAANDCGYGNGWFVFLDQLVTVPDAAAATAVVLDFRLSHDLELDYDFCYFGIADDGSGGGVRNDSSLGFSLYTGTSQNLDEHIEFTVPPAEYVGPESDQIHLRFSVVSDEIYSDEDCQYPSVGAVQIDDVVIALNGSVVASDDFENGDLGNWQTSLATTTTVGNFAAIWSGLEDLDPCFGPNDSPQVAFFDHPDLNVGTGGTPCNGYCYGGPHGGYMVNNTGGLAGPEFNIDNSIISPILPWPSAEGADGATLFFNVYRHQPIFDVSDWDGVCYRWSVRSDNPLAGESIEDQPWRDRGFVYFAGPDYLRLPIDVSDLLSPNRTQVQIRLGCVETLDEFGIDGSIGTPAPYFDNVALVAYQPIGPRITASFKDLAQDAFPAGGMLDIGDPASLSCQFDAAVGDDDAPGTARDAVRATVSAIRGGTQILGNPRLYYRLHANPIFDPYRAIVLAEGYVEGSPAMDNGTPLPDQWDFDLPEPGTLYPGDVLHYYFWARDDGPAEFSEATLPADTTGFSDFSDSRTYNQYFVLRCLPTLRDISVGVQPSILWWNDRGILPSEDRWYEAFARLGMVVGEDFDVYYTQGGRSALGNGLGGRATTLVLAGYETIVYSAGDLAAGTLGDGSTGSGDDPANDVGLLDSWLLLLNKNLCLSGDNLASDLDGRFPGHEFLQDQVGVRLVPASGDPSSIQPLIGHQESPVVRPLAGNSLFTGVSEWTVDGGCPNPNTFDAIETYYGTELVAEFTDPDGAGGAYYYAAATRRLDGSNLSDIVFFPYDLTYVDTAVPGDKAGPIVALILRDVLLQFGHSFLLGPPEPLDGLQAVQVTSANPAGETTRIQLSWPLLESWAQARIYRRGFGNYPEYDDGPGAGSVPTIPVDPDAAEAAGWTLVTQTTGDTFVDDPPTRDYWYYVLYVYEVESGIYSTASNLSAGALNYNLGDVAGGGGPGVGDNLVTTADVSALGASYGVATGDPDYDPYIDIGPTFGYDILGRPQTDNVIDFEDLVVMALNYGDVSKNYRVPTPLAAGRIQLEIPELPAVGGTFETFLTLRGDGSVQGLSVPVQWDDSVLELTSTREGGLLARQGGDHLILAREPGIVDAALLGARTDGISGEGVLAKLEFRVLGIGDPGFSLGAIKARTAENESVELTGEVAAWIPRVTQLYRVAPNPFNPQTTVVYDVARGGDVKLRIYGVDGRLVRTLVSEAQVAGRYTQIWDGTDDQGRSAASGVYLLHLEASGAVQGRKLTLVR